MITGETGVDIVIPSHYVDDYPKFVEFMNAYFKFLYRQRGGMTEAELDDLIETKGRLLAVEMNNTPAACAATDEMVKGSFLERGFRGFMAKDGGLLTTSDNRSIEASEDRSVYINRWYQDMGFSKESVTPVESNKMSKLDDIRIVKLLKSLFEIRGSQPAMELFFSIFFDSKITVEYPREKIAIIDDNFVLDGTSVPRDDNYYSEFSYVIKIDEKKTKNQDLVVDFYKYYFHPSGFKMFIENMK